MEPKTPPHHKAVKFEAPPKQKLAVSCSAATHSFSALAESMNDFTKAFIASGNSASNAYGLTTSQHKIQAANHAQEIKEGILDDHELMLLLNVLQQEPGAADFYLNLKKDSLREKWVQNKILPFRASEYVSQ